MKNLSRGLAVCIIHTDQDTVLEGRNVIEWTHHEGIIIMSSAPFAHKQNGKAERAGQVLLTLVRSLRPEARLPEALWPEFMRTATHLANRTPIKYIGWKTPFGMMKETMNKSPLISLTNLRVLGSKCFVKNHLVSC